MTAAVRVTESIFGRMPDGRPVRRYSLENDAGMRVEAIELGAIVCSLIAPDRDGVPADLVLGYGGASGYMENSPYFGAVVGRYANRVAAGRFRLDGIDYRLTANEGRHHLHGGVTGFGQRLWLGEAIADDASAGVRFGLVSDDGEEGYPGRLQVTATYMLGTTNRLSVRFQATTTRPTIVNLTQHSYFNLSGHGAGSLSGQLLRIAAEAYTPVDDTLIPIGHICPVAGTPFDFRTARSIDRDIDADDAQLRRAGGYDHNFVLSGQPGADGLRLAAVLEDPASGRRLTVLTSEPGMQLYTANALDGRIVGKDGRRYGARSAVCLETQHFPNSPNVPEFPTTVLRQGETYESRTEFAFDTTA